MKRALGYMALIVVTLATCVAYYAMAGALVRAMQA